MIVIGDGPPVAVNPPTFDETTYDVIGEPPLLDGAVKLIVACPLPATAVTLVGASGTVAGVTLLLAIDEVLVPTAFVAVTLKVYAVPFVRPTTVADVVAVTVVNPPTFDVTV